MPLCMLHTNIERDVFTGEFIKEMWEAICKASNSRAVSVHVNPDQIMMRGGSMEPMLYMGMMTFEDHIFSPEKNLQIVEELFGFFKTKLGLPERRIMIFFEKTDPDYCGIFNKLASQVKMPVQIESVKK